jgi:hypothetical protein
MAKKRRSVYIPVPLEFVTSADLAKTLKGFRTRREYLENLAAEIDPLGDKTKVENEKRKRKLQFPFP